MRRAARRAAAAGALLALASGCGDGAGTDTAQIEIFGTFTAGDAESFARSLDSVERDLGVDVRFVGSSSFESDLLARVRRGDAPDLALLPQPGLIDELAGLGSLQPVAGQWADAVRDNVDPQLLDIGRLGDTLYAVPYRMSVKSLVWYSPRRFLDRGEEVPKTWAEMEAIASRAISDGIEPWCLGVRDGGATGWVATDWVEDIVLRFAGPEVYDDWISHDVEFVDAPIAEAVERFGTLALDPTQVYGAPGAALEFDVGDAIQPLLSDSGGCLMHRQASFLPDLVDGSVDFSPTGDLWVFPLPSVDGGRAPLVLGSQLVVRFSESDESLSVAAALARPEASKPWAQRGGFLSPLSTFTPADYGRELERTIDGWARAAEVVRFDASDQMPASVGVDAFWSSMAAYLGGARLTETLATIDAAWPQRVTKPALPPITDTPTEARDG
jgi:alpha-glucoside transport system substrate-binding protein